MRLRRATRARAGTERIGQRSAGSEAFQQGLILRSEACTIRPNIIQAGANYGTHWKSLTKKKFLWFTCRRPRRVVSESVIREAAESEPGADRRPRAGSPRGVVDATGSRHSGLLLIA